MRRCVKDHGLAHFQLPQKSYTKREKDKRRERVATEQPPHLVMISGVGAAGNKEDEEAMMQEWFSLLNGKNELIKRQIELNLV